MKKLPLVIILISLTAVLAAAVFALYKNGIIFSDVAETKTGDYIEKSDSGNLDFLSEEKNRLPVNMIGYSIDPQSDIENYGADGVFDDVSALYSNTVVIEYPAEQSGRGNIETLIKKADEKKYCTAIKIDALTLLTSDDVDYDLSVIDEICTSDYKPQIIIVDGLEDVGKRSSLSETDTKKNADALMTDLKNKCAGYDVKFGAVFDAKNNEIFETWSKEKTADCYFADVKTHFIKEDGGGKLSGAASQISAVSQTAIDNGACVYAVYHNENVQDTYSEEIYDEVKFTYDCGGFSGGFLNGFVKLAADDNQTLTLLSNYFDSINSSDSTVLSLKSAEIISDSSLKISGTADPSYPVLWKNSQSGGFLKTDVSANGEFSVAIPLAAGRNYITLKHRNAVLEYQIDKAVDIIKKYSSSIEDGKVSFKCVAYSGSEVWARLEGTNAVKLEEKNKADSEYSNYEGTFYLSDKSVSNQTDFGAVYNGMTDFDGPSYKDPSPYDDSGLGRANILEITKDYAETSNSSSESDESDPTCTPQHLGAFAYVSKIEADGVNLMYVMQSGMKIYALDSRLIIGGFVMKENSVTLSDIDSLSGDNGETCLKFSVNFPVVTRVTVEPQEYYTGYLDRIYNVNSFTGEYINVMFYDTIDCFTSAELDFTDSPTVSSAEWYKNDEEKIVTLRLYLKNPGKFHGYSLNMNSNKEFELSIRNDADSLSGAKIVLDPGHGGPGSPGTSFNDVIYERDLTLNIALKVKTYLESKGAEVILTREDKNTFVSLEDRVKTEREEKPDAFISIHLDGDTDVSLYGCHSFYYKNYSFPLADSIQKRLVSAYRQNYFKSGEKYENVDKGTKFFPYMVARVEDCPSVLIETGYLTNRENAAILSDSYGQAVMANAIAEGIEDYLTSY